MLIFCLNVLPDDVDLLRRVRVYCSLCPDDYNRDTLYLLDHDPQCQVVIATVAFTNGFNSKSLLDSLSLAMPQTVDQYWQQKGRIRGIQDVIGRGVLFVSSCTIKSAVKALKGESSQNS